jgi:uncharacterized protein (DUF1778 family)
LSEGGFNLIAHKISIYLDDQTHRELKAATSSQGLSLSDFMARSAKEALQRLRRQETARLMDQLRKQITQPVTAEEIREMRDDGRL